MFRSKNRAMLVVLFSLLFFNVLKAQVTTETDTLEDGTILENLPPAQPVFNAVFAELGGTGGAYSLNYDRIIYKFENIKITGRLGYSLLPIDLDLTQTFIIENNYLFGRKKKFLEAGFGMDYYRASGFKASGYREAYLKNDKYIYTMRLGYRFQNMDAEGFFFRAALTPVLEHLYDYTDPDNPVLEKSMTFQLWAGLAIGIAF